MDSNGSILSLLTGFFVVYSVLPYLRLGGEGERVQRLGKKVHTAKFVNLGILSEVRRGNITKLSGHVDLFELNFSDLDQQP